MYVLIFLFLLSVTINVVLVWYIRGVVQTMAPLYENTDLMLEELEDFCEHVNSVSDLPVFYGDPTIKGLLEHSRNVVDSVRTYKENFIFESDKEIEFEEAETEEE